MVGDVDGGVLGDALGPLVGEDRRAGLDGVENVVEDALAFIVGLRDVRRRFLAAVDGLLHGGRRDSRGGGDSGLFTAAVLL